MGGFGTSGKKQNVSTTRFQMKTGKDDLKINHFFFGGNKRETNSMLVYTDTTCSIKSMSIENTDVLIYTCTRCSMLVYEHTTWHIKYAGICMCYV